MWTKIFLMCVFQLQILWINPTLTFSSTNGTSIADTNADLRVTYSYLLGDVLYSKTDKCNTLRLYSKQIHYYNAVSFAVLNNERLLYKNRPNEIDAMKIFLQRHPDKTIWIFAPNPADEKYCYYGGFRSSDEFYTQHVDCTKKPTPRYVITVSGAIKNDTKCPVVDNSMFHKV